MSDEVVYAPTDAPGPLPSVVGLVAALAGLVQVASRESEAAIERHMEDFDVAYAYLTQPDTGRTRSTRWIRVGRRRKRMRPGLMGRRVVCTPGSCTLPGFFMAAMQALLVLAGG